MLIGIKRPQGCLFLFLMLYCTVGALEDAELPQNDRHLLRARPPPRRRPSPPKAEAAYRWVVTAAEASPDGFLRPVIMVNGSRGTTLEVSALFTMAETASPEPSASPRPRLGLHAGHSGVAAGVDARQ